MKTFLPKINQIDRKWHIVDAEGKTLGRLASEVAKVLRGKNKPIYTPHMDTGDFVIVLNAEKIRLTGNKVEQKLYRHHSGYPGGLKEVVYSKLMDKKPEFVIYKAVKGMLPHNTLGRQMFRKLKVYKGNTHNHDAQKPEPLEI